MAIHYVDTQTEKSIPSIRFIPELNLAALRQRKDKELMFWYLLRATDNTGCGHIPLLEAEKAFTELFQYSRRTFYRHLNLGAGKLWEIYTNRRAVIKIYGLKTCLEYFYTFKVSNWIDIDVSLVAKVTRRALLYNTGAYRPFGTGRPNRPISRQSITDVTKIDRRTQQRYDSQANTIKVETKVKNRDPETFKLYKQKLTVSAAGGKQVLIDRQLGNIYTSHATQSHRGQLRKAARAVQERQESFIRAEASHKGLFPSRRFYGCFHDWCKRYLRGKATADDSYYPTKYNEAVFIQCTA